MDSAAGKQTSLKHSGRTNDTLMTLELLSSSYGRIKKQKKKKQIACTDTDGVGGGQRVPSTAVVSFRFCRQD